MKPLLFLLLPAFPCGAATFAIDPPPGWEDVTASRAGPDVVVALQGPETGSFALTRAEPVALDNKGAVRAFLDEALSAVNKNTGLGFSAAGPVTAATYDNGLSASYILAGRGGRPRLVLAVTDFGGATMLATLVSSVPETLLPEI